MKEVKGLREGRFDGMDCKEAQDIVFRLVNLKSDKVTLEEIKHALIVLANFYEDNKPINSNQ